MSYKPGPHQSLPVLPSNHHPHLLQLWLREHSFQWLDPCWLSRLVATLVWLAWPLWWVQWFCNFLVPKTLQGQNLILNMNDKGFIVVAYNRTTSKVDHFLENEAKGNRTTKTAELNLTSLNKGPIFRVLTLSKNSHLNSSVLAKSSYSSRLDLLSMASSLN